MFISLLACDSNSSIGLMSKMTQKGSWLSIFWFALLSFLVLFLHSYRARTMRGLSDQNGTYDVNRGLVLSYLPSNVTAQGGFNNASVGQEPDRVHALGMCISGSKAEDCSKCIQTEINRIISSCPNQTEAYSWSGQPTLCLLRYSNHSFLGSLDLEPSTRLFNTGDLRLNGEMNTNLTEFYRIWKGLVARVVEAASSTNDNSSSSNRKYYAVDIAATTAFAKVYTLMQCTPDISSADCKECLQNCVSDYELCCRQNQGGAIVRPSCLFRWDLFPFAGAFENIMVAPPPSRALSLTDQANTTKKESSEISKGTIAGIAVPALIVAVALLGLAYVVCCREKSHIEADIQSGDDIASRHSLQFDFKTIEAATNRFSDSNKIGQGGFGKVYKGMLPDGTEVAVKRLAKNSRQGSREFKNEVVFVAKLQHRNLVRLLGFCLEKEERILVYEFVPNKSLDSFLFDPSRRDHLDWAKRYKIIREIAKGILYLHQDSRLTVIHRDLKASNILLDADLSPKIADFGMARILGVDQSRAETSRIVGTYGYMSPEYAMHGHFSQKSDVYSFGVLALEIINGKVNSSFYGTEDTPGNLVTHVWRLWRDGSLLELVDPAFGEIYHTDEVTRCIHIALLCVQNDPTHRPTMSAIIMMLTCNTIGLPVPHRPGFFLQSRRDREAEAEGLVSGLSIPGSIDDGSITFLDPR
ncbi:PREDICTED: putative cysteine-rich receptor-like protein kinase 35 [Tarenaya hassleriana]|uniref:putative cysteine-rich receptor-like protein kinase 35 n=1 Tax=Tarenaya hassleriana TaxID=28532 RepID=UPI00053C5C88|nr:PREDICTED: putative cysteine-rich receptor-like protein kinase 35 [Tarenaya hassleriana]